MKFIKKREKFLNDKNIGDSYLPTYEECLEICKSGENTFYEIKNIVDGFNVSVFNYRLAGFNDFKEPIKGNKRINAFELRGLTFVFNKDGSLFNRYILLQKFFNLNQVSDSMYSIVKDYKIKFINNKEDGSVATFIKLPNGKVIGKSKMGFDNVQANSINRIYNINSDIKNFVDWSLNNDYIPIFEFVGPSNRIVLNYKEEELILLRIRDNKTGRHIDLKDHLDKIGTIKISPFEDDIRDLDHLIELTAVEVDKEGYVVTAEDKNGRDFFFKIKTPWYSERHGLLTNDLYREHIIIGYILDEKIDDILGQIPEDEKDAHIRINKIIRIVKTEVKKKLDEITEDYNLFLNSGMTRKEYAISSNKQKNFSNIMSIIDGNDPYDLAIDFIREKTKRLNIAREWLKKIDSSLFFKEPEKNNDD